MNSIKALGPLESGTSFLPGFPAHLEGCPGWAVGRRKEAVPGEGEKFPCISPRRAVTLTLPFPG